MSDKLIPGHINKAFRALFVAVKPELKHDETSPSEDMWTALSGIYDAEKTPENFIPSLAWSWGSFADAAYFDQPLREYLKKSLYLMRRKGTLKTLETAIDMLPDTEDVEIVPWYKTSDVPPGYIVITMFYSNPFTPRIWNALKAVVDSFNRYSAHIYIRIEKRIESTLYIGGVVRVDRVIKMPVMVIPEIEFVSSIFFPMSGMLLPLDTDIFFTGTSTLPSIHIYINGVLRGTAPVIGGMWSVVTRLDSSDYGFDDVLSITAGFYSFTASVSCAVMPDPAIDPIVIECTNIADENTIMRILPFDIEGTADNTDYVHAYLSEYGVSPESVEWDPHYVRFIGTAPVVAGEWLIEGVMLPNDLISGRFRITFTAGAYSSMVEPAIGAATMSILQPDTTVPKYSVFTVSGETNLPARYEGLALKVYGSVFVNGEVGMQRYEIGNGTINADGEYTISCQLPGADIATDECLIEVEYSTVYRAEKELTIVDGTLTIGTYPATIAPDTDMEIAGTSTQLVGATIIIYAKKSTAGDETYVSIGTAVVQPDGTWSKANAQLPSGTFAAGDTANIKAVCGTVQSSVVGLGLESAVPAGVIFVAAGASGANDGTSWDDAYTDLQTAIDSAVAGQEVWVKQGTYYPSVVVGGTGAERDKAFYLKTGVAVYGGFSGSDYIFANRDYTAYETICNANGNYHCFNFKNKTCTRTAILDGFTVRGANGDNSTDNRHRGGGFSFITGNSHPTIRNCKITYHYASYGAAIYVTTSSAPLFENCSIYNMNGADDMVATAYLQNSETSRFTLLNCTFYNSSLRSTRCIRTWDGYTDGIMIDGCTFYNFNNYPVITILKGNSAYADNIINRCVFRDCYEALKLTKTASSGVGDNIVANTLIKSCTYGIEGTDYASIYRNCTLVANTNAFYNYNTTNAGTLQNCIIYGNTNMFARAGYNNFTFTYTDCQTAQAGTGNISSNPNWDVNYNLNAGSPCIDTGNNSYVYGDYDLNGNTRIVNTTVDMGCYERQ